MAITITEGASNPTPSATYDIAVPSHALNDVLVLLAYKSVAASASPAISTGGWTTVFQIPGVSGNPHILVGWKLGTGSETTARVTNMDTGTLDGKVFSCAGADSGSPIVGTPDDATGSSTSTADMSVGTVAVGDAGSGLFAAGAGVTAPGADNGYVLDETTARGAFAHKVMDSADGSLIFNWTTSRAYYGALIVVKASTGGGGLVVPRAMYHRQTQGMS